MIPLSTPNISGKEWEYVKECFDTNWVSSAGSYVNKFEEVIQDYTGSKHAIAIVNGTSALHLSLKASGVDCNDYVITTNITFIASVNAIKYLGANPILVDIDPNTWQMDLDLVENFLETETETVDGKCTLKKDQRRIKAILPIHVLGNMGDMSRLIQICEKYHLALVEDAAEALGSFLNGKHAGTFGVCSALSFNGNKILTTGGGGMILTDDDTIATSVKHISNQAKTSALEYIHDEIGYNYRMVNVLAAMGVAQMENLELFLKRKTEIDQHYKDALKNIGGITFQQIEDEVSTNNWLFTIQLSRANELGEYLRSNDIECRSLWHPINTLPMYKDDLFVQSNNHSGHIHKTCLSIPCSTNITDEQLETVSASIIKFLSA